MQPRHRPAISTTTFLSKSFNFSTILFKIQFNEGNFMLQPTVNEKDGRSLNYKVFFEQFLYYYMKLSYTNISVSLFHENILVLLNITELRYFKKVHVIFVSKFFTFWKFNCIFSSKFWKTSKTTFVLTVQCWYLLNL